MDARVRVSGAHIVMNDGGVFGEATRALLMCGARMHVCFCPKMLRDKPTSVC